MIARLMRGGTAMFVYFCLATIITQAVLFSYLALTWKLDRNKVIQVLAILQGVDLFAMKEQAEGDRRELAVAQVSFDQIRETRALKVHHLELREQALKDGLGQLAFEQRKLADERKRYKQVRGAFNKELLEMQQGALATGTDTVQTMLQSIQAKQAKDLLVRMLENDQLDEVAMLLATMPTTKGAKIMKEFKTAPEGEQLSTIIDRIRTGYPKSKLADETLEELDQSNPTGP